MCLEIIKLQKSKETANNLESVGNIVYVSKILVSYVLKNRIIRIYLLLLRHTIKYFGSYNECPVENACLSYDTIVLKKRDLISIKLTDMLLRILIKMHIL